MKAIMVMYDSLNLKMLESYGCDWTITPNFLRLAKKSVQFQNSYVGSMPCMPARRELHTGRLNFLHRSWGPLEPYDDSMPELLKKAGIYTHLISDHQHYWEDGGATYHNRYSSWEISRGQEGDLWKADLNYKYDKGTVFKHKEMMLQYDMYKAMLEHDQINRNVMDSEEKTSQAVTFQWGMEFIEKNHNQDNWFLQIETFDPHEPFYTLKEDKDLYPHKFAGDVEMDSDWPPYTPVAEDENTVEHVKYEYASLLTKCDRYLGKVLDLMDKYNLWEDTMLIVNTDHGFLLGEHGWWGKTAMPLYDEIAHTPLYIYDPRQKECVGVKRNSIVQTIDLAPTLLEFFGVAIPHDMEGKSLNNVIKSDEKIRDYAVYGYFGSQINITDGNYVYMHSAENQDTPIYEYTLMPTHMRSMFNVNELQDIQLQEPFSFTKGCRVMKIKVANVMGDTSSFGSRLYCLNNDINQENPINDKVKIEEFKKYLKERMLENQAPVEAYQRFGF